MKDAERNDKFGKPAGERKQLRYGRRITKIQLLLTIRSSLLPCFFLLLAPTSAVWPQNAVPFAPSTVEQFKEFISTPKPALLIEATIRERESVRVNGTNYQEQSTRRIQCSWTPTLLAYSEVFELPGRMTRRVDVIRDGDSFTTRSVVGSTNESSLNGGTTNWKGLLKVPVDLDNPVLSTYARAREHFGAVMNFGIPEVEVGAARWDGQHLLASGYGVSQPVTFQGTLTADEAGAPSRLELKRTSSAGILRYEIRYRSAHTTLVGSGRQLPSQFEVYKFNNRDNTNAPVQEISIEKIATVSADDVRREVDKLTVLAAMMTNQFVVQGRVLYERMRDGRLIPDRRLNQPLPFRISYSSGRLLYWSTTSTLVIGFLLFLGRGVRKNINT